MPIAPLPKPYLYPKRRGTAAFTRAERVSPEVEREAFAGSLNGLPASDIEERFARSLQKLKVEWVFRAPYVAGRNMPGEVEVDFVVTVGSVELPIFIDGAFAHKSAEQKSSDLVKQAILDDELKGTGALPSVRIPGDELETQAEADIAARRYILNA